ncbi:MarR family winged helix-turn-helix transcriptional regulator [Microlunatus parietis]|uniref:DNA-binding MarR family transcriptional regulator n=1 Tax=Microlunatus parietis TaxID=682979 RepID=A0A7Y9LB42_9ACTN|nr:MarR family transcriptional regulator [Microlunatus parietis]NYE73499.1 DNA-binding MarR family transcriptional regulator [Microlunatus parietis]
MRKTLSFDLHTLTARLDREADRILRAEHEISYRRFRTLLSVAILSDAGAEVTQRAVAEELGISEPSASRMASILAADGWLDVRSGGGNRRRLSLTEPGRELVAACRSLLEQRFAAVVRRSGVRYSDYAGDTRKLLETLAQG